MAGITGIKKALGLDRESTRTNRFKDRARILVFKEVIDAAADVVTAEGDLDLVAGDYRRIKTRKLDRLAAALNTAKQIDPAAIGSIIKGV